MRKLLATALGAASLLGGITAFANPASAASTCITNSAGTTLGCVTVDRTDAGGQYTTYKVLLTDKRADGNATCVTLETDYTNDGRGWLKAKTWCDGTDDGTDTYWYTVSSYGVGVFSFIDKVRVTSYINGTSLKKTFYV